MPLADQQSVDQQAFKVVSSFIKLPVGNLMSDSLKSTVRRSRSTAPISRPITRSNSNQVCVIFFSLFPNVGLKRSIFPDFLTFRRREKSDSNGPFVIVAALQTDWRTAVPLSVFASGLSISCWRFPGISISFQAWPWRLLVISIDLFLPH